jgi:hypothetical protein
MQVFAAAVRPWIWGTETDQAPRAKEKTNVPQHQDTVQFRTARDRGRNSGPGFARPSQANAAAFDRAVAEVSEAARRLLTSLHTHAPARDRDAEAEKAKERSRLRFG